MFYSWKCSAMLMRLCICLKPAFLQNSCQWFYGLGQLTLWQCYLKMNVVGEGPGASLWLLRHFLSLISSWYVYNFWLNTSKGALFLPSSDVYAWSLLYLFYTLIKLYYTKALSNQALSLALDWIPLIWCLSQLSNNLSWWWSFWLVWGDTSLLFRFAFL